ncbi:hypothetical protein C499_08752 [Halogeometricum borinquense DSM 11551]|uniref:Uncharacterized protein n=1 Tax=Halogeometricum borinquense (strain ATCC 700274 / DSM 11551 / JCM 10706 / KCTC 4070 / PR3) TaxID=469382 RepID=E4NNL0_HALBP|nr:hypothetical protein [Halogeometricum borinquense]ADQ66364.1 hypothetical protein Hbor_07670 [Halogeometricum borinquense DSM 11551]ELY27646.1 hypothetical protein C499_08752 [Halogeometricum borinquense DSM 11551]
MSSTFSLVVPDEKETLATGKQFYRYHVENSKYDDSLDEISEYKHFKENLRQDDVFMIYKNPTTQVVDTGEPSIAEILFKYRDEDGVVRDIEGLDTFVTSLEVARKNLEDQLDDDRMEIVDRTIEMCINLIEFAKKNGYGISF